MTIEEITSEVIESEKKVQELYSCAVSKDTIYAAIALIGAAYSQVNDLEMEREASDFWPFGNFNPDVDAKKNLITACAFLFSQIKKM